MVDRLGARKLYIRCFSAFTSFIGVIRQAWSAKSLITFRVLHEMASGLLAPMAQLMMFIELWIFVK
jgi:hypothetical protein